MMAGFLITGGLVFSIYANSPQASATPGAVGFGGKEISLVPPVLNPPCPAYTLIDNSATSIYSAAKGVIVPSKIGIYTTPPYSLIFLYSNLITPGVNILGEYVPVPFASCSFPFVYSGFLYPTYGRFGIGTSALPGF